MCIMENCMVTSTVRLELMTGLAEGLYSANRCASSFSSLDLLGSDGLLFSPVAKFIVMLNKVFVRILSF